MSFTDFNLDFDLIFDFVKSIAIQVVIIPLRIIQALPEWFKTTVWIVTVLISAYLLYWLYKNREEWRHHKSL